jgi:hypothetical protein
MLPAGLITARGILWLPTSSGWTPGGRKGVGLTAKFDMTWRQQEERRRRWRQRFFRVGSDGWSWERFTQDGVN